MSSLGFHLYIIKDPTVRLATHTCDSQYPALAGG